MTKIRPSPCEACPYRLDVPSGLWAAHEYEKLRGYDRPTGEQPIGVFRCHASPQVNCAGWAQVHNSRGHGYSLLALRIWPPEGGIPERTVELFDSGEEAAEWGLLEVDDPSPEAREMMARLMARHPRLEMQ